MPDVCVRRGVAPEPAATVAGVPNGRLFRTDGGVALKSSCGGYYTYLATGRTHEAKNGNETTSVVEVFSPQARLVVETP